MKEADGGHMKTAEYPGVGREEEFWMFFFDAPRCGDLSVRVCLFLVCSIRTMADDNAYIRDVHNELLS